MVDVKKLSFGCELEWSDIDRKVDIPKELGSWEGPKIAGYYMGSEIDIVNTKGDWKGHGTDPLCINCPVGGEIHTQPSNTIDSQMYRIMRIMDLFNTVSVACPNHGHIHVAIPGIKQDLVALKNLFRYTKKNELSMMKACCGYTREDYDKIMNADLDGWVKSYLTMGDGKQINPGIYEKVEKAKDISEILELLKNTKAIDYDWVTGKGTVTENSHRTCLNLFNLVKGETVEFRIFRASINPVEIYSSLVFAKRYIEEALKGDEGKPVTEILKEGNFKFAPLNFDERLAKGWQDTRQTKGRCGCFKHYTGTCETSEDALFSCIKTATITSFEKGLMLILELVKLDFEGKKLVHNS